MNKYELTVIFKPDFDEEALKVEFEKVTALIEKFNGVVDKVDDWGKRRLAYEIKSGANKFHDGFYYFINFSSPAEAPINIEKALRISESLLRYLIIRIEE